MEPPKPTLDYARATPPMTPWSWRRFASFAVGAGLLATLIGSLVVRAIAVAGPVGALALCVAGVPTLSVALLWHIGMRPGDREAAMAGSVAGITTGITLVAFGVRV